MRVARQVTKLIRVVVVVALAPFGLLSTFAHASAIEEQLDCKSTGHVFISALMQSGEYNSSPCMSRRIQSTRSGLCGA
jgi:hypothetical protein